TNKKASMGDPFEVLLSGGLSTLSHSWEPYFTLNTRGLTRFEDNILPWNSSVHHEFHFTIQVWYACSLSQVNGCAGNMGRAAGETTLSAGLQLVHLSLTSPNLRHQRVHIGEVEVDVRSASEKDVVFDFVLHKPADYLLGRGSAMHSASQEYGASMRDLLGSSYASRIDADVGLLGSRGAAGSAAS
ncbi:hypothetical protein KI387_025869, partial [Taxus chinensis]